MELLIKLGISVFPAMLNCFCGKNRSWTAANGAPIRKKGKDQTRDLKRQTPRGRTVFILCKRILKDQAVSIYILER